MPHTMQIMLLVFTSLCFLLAAFNVRSWINLMALGLFFWVLLRGIETVFKG